MAEDREKLEEAFGGRVVGALRRAWNPSLHPRDRLGRFIDVFKKVTTMPVGTSRSLNDVVDDSPNISLASIFRTPRGWEVRAVTRSGAVGVGITPEQMSNNPHVMEDTLQAINEEPPFPDSPTCPHCGMPSPDGGYLPGHDVEGEDTLDEITPDELPEDVGGPPKPSALGNLGAAIRAWGDREFRQDIKDVAQQRIAEPTPQGIRASWRYFRGQSEKIPKVPLDQVRRAIDRSLKTNKPHFIYWDDEQGAWTVQDRLRYSGEERNERGQLILRGTVSEDGAYKSWWFKQGEAFRRLPDAEGGEQRYLDNLFNQDPEDFNRSSSTTPRRGYLDSLPPELRAAAARKAVGSNEDIDREIEKLNQNIAALKSKLSSPSLEDSSQRRKLIKEINKAEEQKADLENTRLAINELEQDEATQMTPEDLDQATEELQDQIEKTNEALAASSYDEDTGEFVDPEDLRRKDEDEAMLGALRRAAEGGEGDGLDELAEVIADAKPEHRDEMLQRLPAMVRDRLRFRFESPSVARGREDMLIAQNEKDEADWRQRLRREEEARKERREALAKRLGVRGPGAAVGQGSAVGLRRLFFEEPLDGPELEKWNRQVQGLQAEMDRLAARRREASRDLADLPEDASKEERNKKKEALEELTKAHRLARTKWRDVYYRDLLTQNLSEFETKSEFSIPEQELEKFIRDTEAEAEKERIQVVRDFKQAYKDATGKDVSDEGWSFRSMANFVDARDDAGNLLRPLNADDPESAAEEFIRKAYRAGWLDDVARRARKEFTAQEVARRGTEKPGRERGARGGKKRGATTFSTGRRQTSPAEFLVFHQATEGVIVREGPDGRPVVERNQYGASDGVRVSNDGFYIIVDLSKQSDNWRERWPGDDPVRLFTKDGKSARWTLTNPPKEERRRLGTEEDKQEILQDMAEVAYPQFERLERLGIEHNFTELKGQEWREEAKRIKALVDAEPNQTSDHRIISHALGSIEDRWQMIDAIDRREMVVPVKPGDEDRGESFIVLEDDADPNTGKFKSATASLTGTQAGSFATIEGAEEEARRRAALNDQKILRDRGADPEAGVFAFGGGRPSGETLDTQMQELSAQHAELIDLAENFGPESEQTREQRVILQKIAELERKMGDIDAQKAALGLQVEPIETYGESKEEYAAEVRARARQLADEINELVNQINAGEVDNINEAQGRVDAMRRELLEMGESSGLDVTVASIIDDPDIKRNLENSPDPRVEALNLSMPDNDRLPPLPINQAINLAVGRSGDELSDVSEAVASAIAAYRALPRDDKMPQFVYTNQDGGFFFSDVHPRYFEEARAFGDKFDKINEKISGFEKALDDLPSLPRNATQEQKEESWREQRRIIGLLEDAKNERSRLVGDRPRVVAAVDGDNSVIVYGMSNAERLDNQRIIANAGVVGREERGNELITKMREGIPDYLKAFDVEFADFVPRDAMLPKTPGGPVNRAVIRTRHYGQQESDLANLDESLKHYEGLVKDFEKQLKNLSDFGFPPSTEKQHREALEAKLRSARREVDAINRLIADRARFEVSPQKFERDTKIANNVRAAVDEAIEARAGRKSGTIHVYLNDDGTFDISPGKLDRTRHRVATVTGGRAGENKPRVNWKDKEVEELYNDSPENLVDKIRKMFDIEEQEDGSFYYKSKFVIRNFRDVFPSDKPSHLRNFTQPVYQMVPQGEGGTAPWKVFTSPEGRGYAEDLGDFDTPEAAARAIHRLEVDAIGRSGSRVYRMPDSDENAEWRTENNRLHAKPKREGIEGEFVITRHVIADSEDKEVIQYSVARLVPGGDAIGVDLSLHDTPEAAKADIDERIKTGKAPKPNLEWSEGDGDKFTATSEYRGYTNEYEILRTEEGIYYYGEKGAFLRFESAKAQAEADEFRRRTIIDNIHEDEVPAVIVGQPELRPGDLMPPIFSSTDLEKPYMSDTVKRPADASRAMNTGTTQSRGSTSGRRGDAGAAREQGRAGKMRSKAVISDDGEFKTLMRGASWDRVSEVMDGRGGITAVYWDFETTGAGTHGGTIGGADMGMPIQVGAIVVVDGKIVQRKTMWMNPRDGKGALDQQLSPWVMKNVPLDPELDKDAIEKYGTHVTQEFIDSQRPMDEVMAEFQEWLGGLGDNVVMIAHNNQSMEYTMARRLHLDYGVTNKDFPDNVVGHLDTLPMATDALKHLPDATHPRGVNKKGDEIRSVAEGNLTAHFDVEHAGAHNALGDSLALYEVMSPILSIARGVGESPPHVFHSDRKKIDDEMEALTRSDTPLAEEKIPDTAESLPEAPETPQGPMSKQAASVQEMLDRRYGGQKARSVEIDSKGFTVVELETKRRPNEPGGRGASVDLEEGIRKYERLIKQRQEAVEKEDWGEVDIIDEKLAKLARGMEFSTANQEKRGSEDFVPGEGVGRVGGTYRTEIPDENSPDVAQEAIERADSGSVPLNDTGTGDEPSESIDPDGLWSASAALDAEDQSSLIELPDDVDTDNGYAMLGSLGDDTRAAVSRSPIMVVRMDMLDKKANELLSGFDGIDRKAVNDRIRNLLEEGRYGDEVSLDNVLDYNNFIDVKGAVLRKENGYVSLILTRSNGSKVTEHTKERPSPNSYYAWMQRAVAYHGNAEIPKGVNWHELPDVKDDISNGTGVDGPAAHFLADIGFKVREALNRRMGLAPTPNESDGFIALRRDRPELPGFTQVDNNGVAHTSMHADALRGGDVTGKMHPVEVALHEHLHSLSAGIYNPNEVIEGGFIGHEEGLIQGYTQHLLPHVGESVGFDRISPGRNPYQGWTSAYEAIRTNLDMTPDEFYGQLMQVRPQEREGLMRQWTEAIPDERERAWKRGQLRSYFGVLRGRGRTYERKTDQHYLKYTTPNSFYDKLSIAELESRGYNATLITYYASPYGRRPSDISKAAISEKRFEMRQRWLNGEASIEKLAPEYNLTPENAYRYLYELGYDMSGESYVPPPDWRRRIGSKVGDSLWEEYPSSGYGVVDFEWDDKARNFTPEEVAEMRKIMDDAGISYGDTRTEVEKTFKKVYIDAMPGVNMADVRRKKNGPFVDSNPAQIFNRRNDEARVFDKNDPELLALQQLLKDAGVDLGDPRSDVEKAFKKIYPNAMPGTTMADVQRRKMAEQAIKQIAEDKIRLNKIKDMLRAGGPYPREDFEFLTSKLRDYTMVGPDVRRFQGIMEALNNGGPYFSIDVRWMLDRIGE